MLPPHSVDSSRTLYLLLLTTREYTCTCFIRASTSLLSSPPLLLLSLSIISSSYTHRRKSHRYRSFNVEDVSFSIYMHERYKYPLFEHMRTILKMNTFERTIDLVKIFYGYKNGGKKIGRGGREGVGAQ